MRMGAPLPHPLTGEPDSVSPIGPPPFTLPRALAALAHLQGEK